MTNPTEAPMANAIDDVKISGCPFCGATPHRGPTKMQNDQLHGEPFQRYRVWCPKGHASFTEMTEGLAYAAWNTRSPASSQHTGWSDEAVLTRWLDLVGMIEVDPEPDEALSLLRDAIEAALTAASSIAPATGFEVKALIEALTPSGETKAEYIGEFTIAVERHSAEEDDEQTEAMDQYDHVQVPWTTIKEIMAAIKARAFRSSISPSVAKESGEP